MICLAFCLLTAPLPAHGIVLSAPSASSAVLGVWDSGPFDNDAAADWYAQWIETPSWDEIRRLLAAAATSDYLEVDDASIAVAAAAVVSAVDQGRLEALPPSERSPAGLGKPPAALKPAAMTALARVEHHSELAELWAEGDASPWLASLGSIRTGLH